MTARKKVSARKRIQNAQKRARDAVEEGFADLERRLPSNLRSAVRDMRANLRAFQQQLERGAQGPRGALAPDADPDAPRHGAPAPAAREGAGAQRARARGRRARASTRRARRKKR